MDEGRQRACGPGGGRRLPTPRGAAPALAAALAGLALAGCAGGTYSEVTFHNDLGRRTTLGYCADGDTTCSEIRWKIAIDPGQDATQEIRSDGKATRRFLVGVPPEAPYGCFVFHFLERRPVETVPLSDARACGGGRQ